MVWFQEPKGIAENHGKQQQIMVLPKNAVAIHNQPQLALKLRLTGDLFNPPSVAIHDQPQLALKLTKK